LGAIAAPDCLEVLQKHTADSCQEVAETCQLALGRLQYLQAKQAADAAADAAAAGGDAATAAAAAAAGKEEESPYYSVDPTPALPSSTPVEELRRILLDPEQPMFEVGREIAACRTVGSKPSQLSFQPGLQQWWLSGTAVVAVRYSSGSCPVHARL
jgi:deoxyhypusine monooxygenase